MLQAARSASAASVALRASRLSARSTSGFARAFNESPSYSNSDSSRRRPRSESSQGPYQGRGSDQGQSLQRGSGARGGSPKRVQPRPYQPDRPPHFITLADLTPSQISLLLQNALAMKLTSKYFTPAVLRQSLNAKTVAMMFSKRSTRTRVASETSTTLLGGHPMFLGSQDIQLGVNESLEDTAKVVGSMVDGVMARVGHNQEVLDLAKHSPVPIINALSHAWHPTQILADLLTLYETYAPPLNIEGVEFVQGKVASTMQNWVRQNIDPLAVLKGKKIAWVGDMNNVSWELMATCPRLGMVMSVAAPEGYDGVDEEVMAKMKKHGIESAVQITNSPAEALKDADIVVTDTWISMGQEEEKAARLKAFEGYQVTNAMVEAAGANPDWKFLHCLPRHPEEVDDEVFYGPRSLVFPEAENRKWTIMAVFDQYIGARKAPARRE